MKLLRLGLLLVVMIGMVGVGSAHTHTLYSTGNVSGSADTFYSNYSVTDTVTNTQSSGVKMIFYVYLNGMLVNTSPFVSKSSSSYQYTIYANAPGNWSISVNEYNNGDTLKESSSKTFTVVSPSYTHTLSSGGLVNTTFGQGAIIRDDVTSNYRYGTVMDFTWYYPDGSISKTATTSSTTGQYNDTLPSADVLNTWKVKAVEYDSGRQHSYTSEKTFAVTVPEFTFGSFISMSLAGGLFLVMRRKVQ